MERWRDGTAGDWTGRGGDRGRPRVGALDRALLLPVTETLLADRRSTQPRFQKWETKIFSCYDDFSKGRRKRVHVPLLLDIIRLLLSVHIERNNDLDNSSMQSMSNHVGKSKLTRTRGS